MADEYSVTTCRILQEAFRSADVLRPMCVGRYDPGMELTYEVTGVSPATRATLRLEVEKFIGGGFAGQVYRVKVLSIDGGPVTGLSVGNYYALKILIPPSSFSQKFRDAIYKIGFQGDFSLQVNPFAARAGAIWQKLIRRGAKIRFGTGKAVVDVMGTFFDETLGACGEISEWIDGRNWQFEVDEYLGRHRGNESDTGKLGSPEYWAKKEFMAGIVRLFHDMGAPELARQYEWWTAKSQPNVLKRLDADDDSNPSAGLTAVDFRAGLALLPVLPMSPADFKLILKGIARGSLVQFDRGSLKQLRQFIDANAEDFTDLRGALDELDVCERAYRDSLPDITHHHVRLLYDGKLWAGILDGAVTGWRAKGLVDDAAEHRLRQSRFLTVIFAVIGLLPLLGRAIRKIWGRTDYRRHYGRILNGGDYPRRAFRAHFAEKLIHWRRDGRISTSDAEKTLHLPEREWPWRYIAHRTLSALPVFLHRLGTDERYAIEILRYIFVRPIKLYFNADAREQWLRDMVSEGRKKHMLSEGDAERILSRIKEPFIQKYLQSLAVHICTLPITQIVSVAVAWIYAATHPELSPAERATAVAVILVAFQVTPISPGSLVRGLYVLYLVIRERNIKDYNIAVFLGFFKYIGYLAFPLQMAYRYPALARFMAGHWATEAVHIVPVFGEHGALMEHGIFDLFYNWPLTVRRRMRERAMRRTELRARIWHVVPVAVVVVALFGVTDIICRNIWGVLPTLKNIWPAAILLPMLVGVATTLGAGGAKMLSRIKLTMVAAAISAAGYTAVHAALALFPAMGGGQPGAIEIINSLGTGVLWNLFIFTTVATIAALLTEINLPEPKSQNHL